tara:strand:+ start:39 stop:455 length:417 start_codon:yes stop_codon:yes gene_type:complete
MKKKYTISPKDVEEWSTFIENLNNIENKDSNYPKKKKENKNLLKLDLHGLSLAEANNTVTKFINDSFKKNYKKLLIITGKGLRSKVYNDPYRSKKMSILKNSVPDYIESNEDLSKKIKKISQASLQDGGDGAFYIFLK